jgi:hypothetical protein
VLAQPRLYEKQRASAKPSPPVSKGTPDEQYAKFLVEQRQSLEKSKQHIAKMPPDMQKQMQSTLKQMEANIERSAKDQQTFVSEWLSQAEKK